jgi:hypothetical protein
MPRTRLAVMWVVVAACSTSSTTLSQESLPGASTTATSVAPAPTTVSPTTVTATAVTTTTEATGYVVDLDPSDFVDVVDNPFFPLLPGTRWVYEGEDADAVEHIEVEVTRDIRVVLGINAVVIRDTVTVDGEVVEDTFDWYAQDRDGTVWYLGEDTKEYEGGEVVSTEGSWEAGVDGALPGIIMEADPRIGNLYRQEYLEGEAEDMAEIVRLGEVATTPFDSFDGVIVIREWTPLEPGVAEEKYYAAGVGNVREVLVEGGSGVVELIAFEPGA